jgi:hypothetical protein
MGLSSMHQDDVGMIVVESSSPAPGVVMVGQRSKSDVLSEICYDGMRSTKPQQPCRCRFPPSCLVVAISTSDLQRRRRQTSTTREGSS